MASSHSARSAVGWPGCAESVGVSLAELYPWLKALHVASVLAFVGGLLAISLVLPVAAAPGTGQRSLAAAAHRWDRQVTVPALLLVWALGLTLAVEGRHFGKTWLQLKLVLVVALSALHGVQSGRLRRLAGGEQARSGRLAPVIIATAAGIAVLAIAKPF